MEKIKTLPVKGTEDIAPKRMMLLEGMLSKIKEIYSRNGFNQIQTPILENLELIPAFEHLKKLKLHQHLLQHLLTMF